MKQKPLTTKDLLQLEAKMAQAKIDAIKKLLVSDKSDQKDTRVPVVVQKELRLTN